MNFLTGESTSRSRRIALISAAVLVAVMAGGHALVRAQETRRGSQGRAAADWTQPDICRVERTERIGPLGQGLDWGKNNLLLISRPDDNNIQQVHVIRPDGSEVRCLTCGERRGGPVVGVHKGVAHWHPSGDYIFLQVEREKHDGNRRLSQPGSGRHNDIWATTPTGDRWWQLTNDPGGQAGVLFPVPSNDGTRLAWAERYAGPQRPVRALMSLASKNPTKDIWGQWRLKIADIEFDRDGSPSLRNIRQFKAGDAMFYEMQVWSPDDSRLYVAADVNRQNPYHLDIVSVDVKTQRVQHFLGSAGNWEEHLSFSPDARKVVFMSSECCKWNPNDLATLVAELYLADADGSHRVQLTDFNGTGAPQSSPSRSTVVKAVWGPDGRRIAFGRILMDRSTAESSPADLWMLTFRGACGGSGR